MLVPGASRGRATADGRENLLAARAGPRSHRRTPRQRAVTPYARAGRTRSYRARGPRRASPHGSSPVGLSSTLEALWRSVRPGALALVRYCVAPCRPGAVGCERVGVQAAFDCCIDGERPEPAWGLRPLCNSLRRGRNRAARGLGLLARPPRAARFRRPTSGSRRQRKRDRRRKKDAGLSCEHQRFLPRGSARVRCKSGCMRAATARGPMPRVGALAPATPAQRGAAAQ
jgi:hypothetical protein